jgi:hypothetical protein
VRDAFGEREITVRIHFLVGGREVPDLEPAVEDEDSHEKKRSE